MTTKEIKKKIYSSMAGDITSPVDDALLDICVALCDVIDGLEKRVWRLEGRLSVCR